MNRVFTATDYFIVPDGTDVSPFLNATDSKQPNVPWGALGDMSIAAGRIKPGTVSWIHMLPVSSQVTYLVSGRLHIKMKDDRSPHPYELELRPGDAVLNTPGTLFQLRNSGSDPAQVLYIVSPSFVFEKDDGVVLYNDAVLVAETWEALEAAGYDVPALHLSVDEVTRQRSQSLRRLMARKSQSQTAASVS
jgi:mannose-6-phosphate isomerase-like protein (cupin superfamily)